MISLLSISYLILFISSIIIILASLLSKKRFIDREKASPFERGFDPPEYLFLYDSS